jgi:hypothetical protein
MPVSAKMQKYRYVDDLPIFKAPKIMIFFWMPNHQTDQNYCRYYMDTLCLPQAVYECQTQKPKGGKP